MKLKKLEIARHWQLASAKGRDRSTGDPDSV